jgi:hypothetical protein
MDEIKHAFLYINEDFYRSTQGVGNHEAASSTKRDWRCFDATNQPFWHVRRQYHVMARKSLSCIGSHFSAAPTVTTGLAGKKDTFNFCPPTEAWRRTAFPALLDFASKSPSSN